VRYWADLQSEHGFRCYDNIHVVKIALYIANAHSAEREMSASAGTRSMAGFQRVQDCLVQLSSVAAMSAVTTE